MPWDKQCLRCRKVSREEFIATMKPLVEEAEIELAEINRRLSQNKGNPDVLLVGPSGGPYVSETSEGSDLER